MPPHIDPYVTHGEKGKRIRKMTVSVPIEIYETIQAERQRRIDNRMRHATASELLCEAFAHAFTGQPLPTDEELIRYLTKATKEKYKHIRKEIRDKTIDNALTVAQTFLTYPDILAVFKNIQSKSTSPTETAIYLYRFILLFTTFVISETSSPHILRNEAQNINGKAEKNTQGSRYQDFLDFLDYNKSNDRISTIATNIKQLISENKNP